MKPTIISILGRPLAGKDTQAALLSRDIPGAIVISTGELIREVKKTGPSHRFWQLLGGSQIDTMDKGILVSEDAINAVFEQVVHEKLKEGKRTIIATAHPHTQKELTSFDAMVEREGLKPVFVNIYTSEHYMYELHKTRNHDRADDNISVLGTREQEFTHRTKPMLDRLRQEGRLVEIHGEAGIENVYARLKESLRSYVRDPEITPTILALIGKPLAGKDTQADLLVAAHPEAVKISTGHILRGVAEEGETHRFWPLVGPYVHMLEQGLKLPDEPTLAMLEQVMEEQIAQGKELLIVAGSPRGMVQLDGFKDIAERLGSRLVFAHIEATDEETYRRSAARNEGRVDDTPAVHKVRLDEYTMHVLPVVNALQREGKIIELNGMKPIEHVFRDLEHKLLRPIIEPEIRLSMRARR